MCTPPPHHPHRNQFRLFILCVEASLSCTNRDLKNGLSKTGKILSSENIPKPCRIYKKKNIEFRKLLLMIIFDIVGVNLCGFWMISVSGKMFFVPKQSNNGKHLQYYFQTLRSQSNNKKNNDFLFNPNQKRKKKREKKKKELYTTVKIKDN